MNAKPSLVHPSAHTWLQSSEGKSHLRKALQRAEGALQEKGLPRRLADEQTNSAAGGSARMKFGNSLRLLSEEIAMLALGHAYGLTSPDEAWTIARTSVLPLFESTDELNFQGRNSTPPWCSDLWTADIAVNLAAIVSLPSPLQTESSRLKKIIREKCITPILADWTDGQTRIHSLDTMGHNWWSVVVGGAGIASALIGDSATASDIAQKLGEWFRFPGNSFSRKQPNFGPEGDFVEGIHYAEYALSNVCLFEQVHSGFQLTPDGLDSRQIQGLADWLQGCVLPTKRGPYVQRFSDINPRHHTRAEVWHTVARHADSKELLALAHELKPSPEKLPEFLLWEPARPGKQPTHADSLKIFPISGLAFDHTPNLAVTLRAGEYWNHNHLDAGTFIFAQDDVVWIDDAGTCGYGHPDYLDYFVSPEAHNVAYAPALRPPLRHAFREGISAPARFVASGRSSSLSAVCIDTGMLSGNALSRSYRWCFRLDQDGIVIWDDFSAYTPQEFVSRLHTQASPTESAHHTVTLRDESTACRIAFFSDASFSFSSEETTHGADPKASPPFAGLRRSSLSWRTEAAERTKLGLALSTRWEKANWSGNFEDGGWQFHGETSAISWQIWFNPACDGRNTHLPPNAHWREFETDAYALILRKQGSELRVIAIEASILRVTGKVAFANLSKHTVTEVVL